MARRKHIDPLDESDDLLAPEGADDEALFGDAPEPPPSELDDELGPAAGGEALDLGPDDAAVAGLPDGIGTEPAEAELARSPGDEGPQDDDGGADDDMDWEGDLLADGDEDDVDPDDGEEPSTGLDGFDDELASDPSDEDWAALEDEGQHLTPGRVLIGYKEFASLPDLGVGELVARCDTGAERSSLVAAVTPGGGDRARLRIAGYDVEVPISQEGGALVLRTRLQVGPRARKVRLILMDGDDDVTLVLGRDALEGHFVVDVALGFLHRAERVSRWPA